MVGLCPRVKHQGFVPRVAKTAHRQEPFVIGGVFLKHISEVLSEHLSNLLGCRKKLLMPNHSTCLAIAAVDHDINPVEGLFALVKDRQVHRRGGPVRIAL